MQKEIGSNFWLSPEEANSAATCPETMTPAIWGYNGNDFVWTSTGRSASAIVIRTIEERNPGIKKIVCLPPFTCHTVFEPFVKAGYKVVTFPMTRNLTGCGSDIVRCALENNAGIVLFHRYFGFDTISDLNAMVSTLRAKGIVTIEDATQSLYSSFAPASTDYHVASIRKWCGVPDGAFAVCRDGSFSIRPDEADRILGDAKTEASILKYDWIVNGRGEKDVFLRKYREAEDILSSQDSFHTIHPLSLAVQSNLNVESMKERRRENSKILLEGIANIEGMKPVFNKLDPDVVPLYFPILCEDRSAVQSLLARNDVFAPVVWPKDSKCPDIDADADYIYDHILCIPLDQRYEADDMQRIISILTSSK